MDTVSRHPSPRRLLSGASALALLVALGACGHSPRPAEPVVVALTATALEPPPTLPPAASDAIRAALDGNGAALDGNGGDLRILVEGEGRARVVDQRELVLRRGAEVEHDAARREQLTAALLADVGARTSVPGAGRLDLLGLLTEVGRLPGPARVIVQSSGLQTAAPLDLSLLGWDFRPEALAADVATRGYLPDLHGKDLTFVGLGQGTGAQRPLPTPLQRRLVELWTAICTSAQARSCVVDERPVPEGAGPDRGPGVPVPVPVPVADSVTFSGGGEAALPTDLLFAPDSADLLPGAAAQLDPVVAALAARGGRVDLTGHTAAVGPREGARALSAQRARAVAAALIGAGVPGTRIGTVRGVGYDEPLPGDATANRSVIATIKAGVA